MSRSSTMQLPSGWSRRRLRFDARTNPVNSGLDMDADTEVSFVPMDAVGELGGLRLDQNRELADVYNGYTYFADGDVCIAKITPCFENGKGALAEGLTNGVAFGTTELHVLRPSPTLDARYLFYLTIAHDFRSQGESEMLGAGGQKRVPEDFLKDWRPALPRVEIQQRIARFLDEKTARIDALIEKKRALLERLAEKRQALITRAVTKGLNPDVPMKPSGVGWFGDVPVDWEVVRLKNVILEIVDAEHKTAPEADSGEYLIVRTANVRNGELILDSAKFTDHETYLEWTKRAFPEFGDILLTREAPAGEICLVPDNPPLLLGQRMVLLKPIKKTVSTDYLVWMLSGGMKEFVELTSQGSTVPHFNMSDIGRVPVLIPSLSEQAAIVAFIEKWLSSIRSIRVRVIESMGVLIDFRNALITAAITGQLPELNG
jgi:type I restriction enzyme, S subunit